MLLHNAERQRCFKGVVAARGAPRVSYLLFANDCFLFRRASLEDASTIMDVITLYERVSAKK